MIFDEAHELEDVASSYFGISVSNVKFEELVRDLEITLRAKQSLGGSVQAAGQTLRERARMLFAVLPIGTGYGEAAMGGWRSRAAKNFSRRRAMFISA